MEVVELPTRHYFFNVVLLDDDPEAASLQDETKRTIRFRVEAKEGGCPFDVVSIKYLGFDLVNGVMSLIFLDALEVLVQYLREKLGWKV